MKCLMKKTIAILLSVTMCFILLGCNKSESSSDNGTIKLVYVNWAEGIAMTNLAKVVLEEKMGYKVEVTMADAAPIFASLANGDQDVFMDAWLPVTHESYMDKYGDDLEDLGINFKEAKIGLVVPSYMDVTTISDLKNIADKLSEEIIGIDSGAGIMKATETAIDKYGLNLKLITGSGPAMTAALKTAIENKKPIVVTGWTPHWKFAKWDLKFLEDPEGIYGDAENIHTITRKGFQKDMPKAAEFFSNFYLSGEQLGDLMGAISDSKDDPDVVAKAWMEANEDVIDSWIPVE